MQQRVTAKGLDAIPYSMTRADYLVQGLDSIVAELECRAQIATRAGAAAIGQAQHEAADLIRGLLRRVR